MTDNVVTADLSQFGYRELKEATKLLEAYTEDRYVRPSVSEWIGDGLTLNFNTSSGYVFLSDEDYHTFLINEEEDGEDGKLDIWLSCPNCGKEGFPKELIADPQCDDCKEHAEHYL